MKKKWCIILCILGCIFMAGCSRRNGTEMNIYYVNVDGNALAQDTYVRKEENGTKAAKEAINAMQTPKDERNNKSAIPNTVKVKEIRVKNGKAELEFTKEYSKMNRGQEVLLRAAIVQTLVQLPDVNYVSFYIEGEALKDSYGDVIGAMRAEDFIQNTGSLLREYQLADLKLYFANIDGTKLSAEKRTDVRYNINTSIEKLVVEQLMKGTSSDKRKATIPSGVKLLGVSIKDEICYVNFDSSFLSSGFNQKPEVIIYSIVNSIIKNGNVTQVQILVDGSSDVLFLGSMNLSEPFSWREDFIED